MILLVDNYDSFVYNLQRYFVRLGQTVEVVRNDAIDFAAIEVGRYKAIVISPGPKGPDQAGDCLKLVAKTCDQLPILGICLGHQILWQAFGGKVMRSREPIHGRASDVLITAQSKLLASLPNPFTAARYHSLIVDPQSQPKDLIITAKTHDGVVMAFEHRKLRLYGLQFHPESILTEVGYPLLTNFLQIAGCQKRSGSQEVTFDLPSSDLVVTKGDHQIADHPTDRESEGPAIAVIPGMAW